MYSFYLAIYGLFSFVNLKKTKVELWIPHYCVWKMAVNIPEKSIKTLIQSDVLSV